MAWRWHVPDECSDWVSRADLSSDGDADRFCPARAIYPMALPLGGHIITAELNGTFDCDFKLDRLLNVHSICPFATF